MIFFVLLQVVGQMIDFLSEQGDLNIGGAGIALMQLKSLDRLRLRFHSYQFIQ